MPKINFMIFTEKINKTKFQTIHPPRPDINIGDTLYFWWGRKGLKKDAYCIKCAKNCEFVTWQQCKTHTNPTDLYVSLPHHLGTGVCTGKEKITIHGYELSPKPWSLHRFAQDDGFLNAYQFFQFFDKYYGTKEKPVEFELIKWKPAGARRLGRSAQIKRKITRRNFTHDSA